MHKPPPFSAKRELYVYQQPYYFKPLSKPKISSTYFQAVLFGGVPSAQTFANEGEGSELAHVEENGRHGGTPPPSPKHGSEFSTHVSVLFLGAKVEYSAIK